MQSAAGPFPRLPALLLPPRGQRDENHAARNRAGPVSIIIRAMNLDSF